MFVFVFRGAERDRADFEALLRRYAAWLGLGLGAEGYPLPGGASLGLFRAVPGTARVDGVSSTPAGRIVVSASFARPEEPFDPEPRFDPCRISTDAPIPIWVDPARGAIGVRVPLVTPVQVYWAGDARGLIVASDLRPLLAWTGFRLDPTGVASLLQYGNVPPPHTLASGVRRVPCGHVWESRSPDEDPRLTRWVPPVRSWKHETPPADPVADTMRDLDGVLRDVPDESVVFFSGGTDSGLIAARLAGLGRRDVRLVHYAFGAADPSVQAADRMAGHLRLPLERVAYDTGGIVSMCATLGADFSFPFCDLSTIPSRLLVQAAASRLTASGAVLLGIGADDLYEGGTKVRVWRKLLALPAWVRQAVARGLWPLEPWWSGGPIGKLWGICYRTLGTRYELAPLIAANHFRGIGYRIDEPTQLRIEEAFRQAIGVFSEGLPPEDRLCMVHLMNGSMGWEAPKFETLRRMGVHGRYPFLDGPMLRRGLSLDWDRKTEGRKEKVLLKRALALSVPRELVELPKRGFSPPFREMLRIEEVQQRMREELLGGGSRLDAYYEPAVARAILDRGRAGSSLGRSSMNLLWTVFFAAVWLRQVRDALC